jgi:hypothetical protein
MTGVKNDRSVWALGSVRAGNIYLNTALECEIATVKVNVFDDRGDSVLHRNAVTATPNTIGFRSVSVRSCSSKVIEIIYFYSLMGFRCEFNLTRSCVIESGGGG